MKQLLLYTLLLFFLACSGVKNTQKVLNIGDYDQAIRNSVDKIRRGKTKKSNQEYILIMEEAFAKAVVRDQKKLDFLKAEGNDENLEKIYTTYMEMKNRQVRISPLLPLKLMDQGREAKFAIENYDSQIIDAKSDLTAYLYTKSMNMIKNARNKGDYRGAYEYLTYIERINPGHKDVAQRIEEVHYKGTDFVKVVVRNNTNMVIPKRLESDLLNFDTYGLDNLWTVYHGVPQTNTNYDYEMEVALREINISPEKVTERQLEREKIVNDGWEYVKDKDGKVVLDSEGNKLKRDLTKKVRCEYYEFKQFKAVNVQGNVRYKNSRTNQTLETFPLKSEFVFEHIYANYNGDKRALDNDLVQFLGLQAVPFPSNEQMVYDTGEDLKNRLKRIISQQNF